MDKAPFSKKVFLASLTLSLTFLSFLFFKSFFYNKTRIVFCDVGQGDGAYIRTHEGADIVIDAGRDKSILSCLGKYMPFYDRTVELAFLSHPQFDHYEGFNYIIDRYNIETFLGNAVDNNNKSYNLLKSKLRKHDVEIKNIFTGDSLDLSGGDKISFIWPSEDFVSRESQLAEAAREESSKNVLGARTTTGNLNDFSQIFIFSEGDFDVLFTGDINTNRFDCNLSTGPVSPSPDLIGTSPGSTPVLKSIEVLKVPHHGSKNGMTEDFLKTVNPELSIISVGKNSYGHPSPEILEMLTRLKKKYLRTDKEGDIVVEIDEKGWRVVE